MSRQFALVGGRASRTYVNRFHVEDYDNFGAPCFEACILCFLFDQLNYGISQARQLVENCCCRFLLIGI